MRNIFLAVIVSLFLSGCGYSSGSLLSEKYDSIHVTNFVNRIDPAAEVSERRMSYTYWPGLEINLTQAVIDRFVLDRHVDVRREDEASMILKGELVDYRQVPLSYDDDDNVEEMRTLITVDLELYDGDTGSLIWRERGFTGWATYDLVGPNIASESEGVNRAVRDISLRIVERVTEVW